MKFISAIILHALLAFAGGLFFPWWIIAVTSFIVGLLIHQRALIAYVAGFLGVAMLWAAQALWIDFQNNHVLTSRIANVLPLGGSSAYLIEVTALVGGFVSAFAAMTASYLRPVKKKEKEVVQKEEAAFVS